MAISNHNIDSETVRVRKEDLTKLLTCSICNNIFNDPVNITECLHIFCNRCIRKKIAEENLKRCPVCAVDLGSLPLNKIRPDHNWSSIRATIAPSLGPAVKDDDEQSSGPAEKSPARRKERYLSSLVKNESIPGPSSSSRRRKAKERKAFLPRGSATPTKNPHSSVEERSEGSGKILMRRYDADAATTSSPPSGPKLRPVRKNRGRPKKTDQPEGLDAQNFVNTASSQHANRVAPVWLSLVPSDNQEGVGRLPQIPRCYLRIKNATLPVSSIKKYLVQKLGLDREDEVEISLWGSPLSSNLELHTVVDLWSQTNTEKLPAKVGDSAEDFVMVLSYGQKHTRPRN